MPGSSWMLYRGWGPASGDQHNPKDAAGAAWAACELTLMGSTAALAACGSWSGESKGAEESQSICELYISFNHAFN